MVIALAAFVRLYVVSHAQRAPEATQAPPAAPAPNAGPSAACRTLDKALEAALREPESGKLAAQARLQLDACGSAPMRACELGPALEARSPLSAGDSPLRDLLSRLCQQCASGMNPCAQSFSRSLQAVVTGQAPDAAALRWNLEHAGPATSEACTSFVRATLVPAALATEELSPGQRSVLGVAAPLCARTAGALPASVVNAAAVQQGSRAPELVKLAASPAITAGPVKPDEVLGAPEGRNVFDGNEKTGVDLGNTVTGKRWDVDGALRAQFAPPIQQLASLRVRASGPGTLRAIVRTPKGAGLEDTERGMSFVAPTACHFKGTGQWEQCKLEVPLLDVDALSVFPEAKKVSLYEVEALGMR
jgi:hypothetical protein